MADAISKRYVVVTGSNKGIGFAICKLLASKGIVVVLTARDEKRGLEAVDKLKLEPSLSDLVFFHQLDVSNPASISSLANFIKRTNKDPECCDPNLCRVNDVNNAGVLGCIADADALRAARMGREQLNWSDVLTTTYKLTEECININYYGAKRMVDALIGPLQLSDLSRIVNVSSTTYKLTEECININYYGAKRMVDALIGPLQLSDLSRIVNVSSSGRKLAAKNVFRDAECLTEEKVDEVLKEFLKDFRQGSLGTKGWPAAHFAYLVSKAVLNAYTRILAAKYPTFRANCVCPGFVKTDILHNIGFLTLEEGVEGPVSLSLLPDDGPFG